ncbi:MAG: hypothetical protein A3F72_19995 [Bacteroidetes bacterium RIFCSPLOWO2_12_FULL_35_15]|nr:MAG: hypothetical protein A3F72_19995 [Bacteroidetes bacterium RIFCSPLOWO2_12_FULL_35_15]
MKPIFKTIIWLTVFSIAMGYMESAVVVYLRKIYYPGGFKFPLVPVSPDIAITEFFREVATIIMLVGVGVMVGKNTLQRFAFFIFSFAIWDIFYYVFLKVLLNWPGSLFDWDILFLIPVPWVGPVIAPCITSLTMIVLTMIIVYYQEKETPFHIAFFEWVLFIFGSITSVVSFMWDYIIYLSQAGKDKAVWTLSSNTEMFDEVKHYIPQHFNWWLFGIGEGMILFAIFLMVRRLRKSYVPF